MRRWMGLVWSRAVRRAGAILSILALLVFPSRALAAGAQTVTEFPAHGLNARAEPGPLVAGAGGNLWFTDGACFDGGTCAIGRITMQGQVTEFTHGLISGTQPQTIVAGRDGNMWFTDSGCDPRLVRCGAIGRITPRGQITEFMNGLTTFSRPVMLVPGADGNVWFTDCGYRGGCAIGRTTPHGQTTEFTSGLSARSQVWGIASGSDGNVWFEEDTCDTLGDFCTAIGRITPQGRITEFRVAHLAVDQMVSGADGNLWFITGAGIARITPQGQVVQFPNTSRNMSPGGLLLGPDGNMWFGDGGCADCGGTAAIGRITPQGQITEFSSGLLNDLGWILAAPDGNLWFTDDAAGAIGRVTPQGRITEPVKLTAGRRPAQIGVGPDGNLWFTEYCSSRACGVGRLALHTGAGVLKVGRAKTTGADVSVPLSCRGGAPCTATLTVTLTQNRRRGDLTGARGRVGTTRKASSLATKTLTLAAGQTKTVHITLNSRAKRLLKSRRTLRAKLAITEAVGSATRSISSQTLTFRSSP